MSGPPLAVVGRAHDHAAVALGRATAHVELQDAAVVSAAGDRRVRERVRPTERGGVVARPSTATTSSRPHDGPRRSLCLDLIDQRPLHFCRWR